MKEKLYERIKNSRTFTKNDILVYTLVLALILILFLSFTIFNKATEHVGFTVTIKQKPVLTYLTKDKSVKVESEFTDLVAIEKINDVYYITVYSDHNRVSFNKFTIDTIDNVVDLVEANCSTSKECVHMPSIKDQGFIYCAIHDLKIIPTGSGGFSPPIVG